VADANAEWMDDAACKDHDSKWWLDFHLQDTGKRHCLAHCTVIADCLAYAMANRITEDGTGVWGGQTPAERRGEWRRRRR